MTDEVTQIASFRDLLVSPKMCRSSMLRMKLQPGICLFSVLGFWVKTPCHKPVLWHFTGMSSTYQYLATERGSAKTGCSFILSVDILRPTSTTFDMHTLLQVRESAGYFNSDGEFEINGGMGQVECLSMLMRSYYFIAFPLICFAFKVLILDGYIFVCHYIIQSDQCIFHSRRVCLPTAPQDARGTPAH